ncbi:MAG: tRNA (adenosine(37)-N6)-dimethylallyltransferase MiaA [Spirochaetales bacterium]|nr:tRNA (adenosine(37)-N6)-dimethylallyltransferase MiaA [Spirochaetales bacterium]
MNTKTNPKVILLFGPTGVGKTDLVDSLFSGRGEIISADSMQVYKYMDIGTAKPSRELLGRLPHHLIDIIDPKEQFHTGEFTRRSETLISDISSRDLVPVISGGTGFYYKNFLFGMPGTPIADLKIREELVEQLRCEGLGPLYDELSLIDPPTADRVAPADSYRILRALEVYRTSGKPLSSYPPRVKIREDLELLIIGLDRERRELYERIDLRVEIMWERGLVSEFRALHDKGYRTDDPGMQGIGYGEFFRMLREPCLSLDGVKKLIQQNSRRYAKRQLTFFRKIPGVKWFHPEKDQDEISRTVEAFLSA